MWKQFNRAKKGISPVVATVILVAVAVVIAAALAGFSSSLFGTYSSSGSIAVKTMTIDADGDGAIELVNRGGLLDSVASIHVPGVLSDGTSRLALTVDTGTWNNIYLLDTTLETSDDCVTLNATPGESPDIPANSEGTVCFVDVDQDPGVGVTGFIPGQQITVKIKMTSGVELTQSVTVQPPT
jgi:flagellin-like protein